MNGISKNRPGWRHSRRPAIALLVCLTFAGCGQPTTQPTTAATHPAPPEAKPPAEETAPAPVAQKPPSPPRPANDLPAEVPVKWLSVGDPFVLGQLEFVLKEARLGRLERRGLLNRDTTSPDNQLTISYLFAVTNKSPSLNIEFFPWPKTGKGAVFSEVTDDLGHTYHNLGADRLVEDSGYVESLAPGQSINMTLVFEKPVVRAKALALKLSNYYIDKNDRRWTGFKLPLNEFRVLEEPKGKE
ncbi:hypothetical protein [Zavarzinella formosa]|uniref:hypothetical protein n=1 Tax=Zavarzinella formosa TaxID=360055 RepID=UPI00031A4BB8|nr:hypothetical protein [Zavarzinella formosa]